ncbi:MAG: 6,7-dimethyl-8-ribityllumazine synthase [Candidatus Eisenbacteria bacterium]|nr:6,7-dimethyl-8-ribityllumazine synthase [Candidatus Latescibacterota bacterium]MBD3302297.1 6,7-dimethyl-8-ribityllumazine synthase [Candidatus Eisenbacteria bacterium]
MSKEFLASLDASGRRFALVASRYSRTVTDRLIDGAVDCLKQHDVSEEGIEVVWVPGSFEIPLAAQAAARSGRFDAVLGLGCVLRGDTPHFEHISREVSRGLFQVGYDTGVPTVFGVITADTVEQAIERSGFKGGGRGYEAALVALEMIGVIGYLAASPAPRRKRK